MKKLKRKFENEQDFIDYATKRYANRRIRYSHKGNHNQLLDEMITKYKEQFNWNQIDQDLIKNEVLENYKAFKKRLNEYLDNKFRK